MKLMWTGSDVLYATWAYGKRFPTKKLKIPYFYGCTLFAKIADLFVEGHYVVSEHMIERLKPLKLRKSIKVLADPPKSFKRAIKKPHKGFNILYYRPKTNNQPFVDWCYGYDVVLKIIERIEEIDEHGGGWASVGADDLKKAGAAIRVIEVDGSSDMSEMYPYIDFCVRPNRSDGNPRMIMECEQFGIPYYWSKENPDIEDILTKISCV